MRRVAACLAALCPASASAIDVDLTASTTVVPGTRSEAVEVETLSGSVPIGAESDPTFRFGLGALVRGSVAEHTTVSSSWGLYRVQPLCDTCASGAGPGWVGPELVRSTDLTVRVAHTVSLGEEIGLLLDAGAVLPASRAALACNPMYGAPGAGVTFQLPIGASSISAGVSARRPLYRFDAAPIGRCASPLRDGTVDTLTGRVEPSPWSGERYGSPNPILTGAGTLRWADPHALLVPAAHWTTAVSTGLWFTRNPAHPDLAVSSLTGPVEVAAAANPVRTSVPWSVELGWRPTERWSATASVSNQLPTLLADPGGTFRALPATTSVGLAVGAHL